MPTTEKGGGAMETRETQRPVDVKELTKRAISLYLTQAAGEGIDPARIEQLRQDARSFPDPKEFKDFRVAVGTTALQGKFTFGGKDAGPSIMGLLFEDDDQKLYSAVVILSQALEMIPRDYTITTFLHIFDEVEERRKAGDIALLKQELEKSGYAPEEFDLAERQLKDFLFGKAGANIREQLLLRKEAEREGRLIKELETDFLGPKPSAEIKKDLDLEKQRLRYLWDRLKEAGFEEAPLLTREIINSRALLEELKQELKMKSRKTKGKGKSTEAESQFPPEEAVARNWALALFRLAKINRLEAEEIGDPDGAAKLLARARKYEKEAETLLYSLTRAPQSGGVK